MIAQPLAVYLDTAIKPWATVTVFTHNCIGYGSSGHGCSVEIPNPRVTPDEPYF